MINISYKKINGKIKNIIIKGHADFAAFNKDIVCASISSMAICSINACLSINELSLKYEIDDAYIKVFNINEDEITQKILINMLNMFKELKSQYPKNINIKE